MQAKKKRCDASVISSSTLISFYLLLLTIYVSPYLHKTAPHHMNRTELTPEPITVSSHPSIPLFPPPLPSSFPFLAGLVCRFCQVRLSVLEMCSSTCSHHWKQVSGEKERSQSRRAKNKRVEKEKPRNQNAGSSKTDSGSEETPRKDQTVVALLIMGAPTLTWDPMQLPIFLMVFMTHSMLTLQFCPLRYPIQALLSQQWLSAHRPAVTPICV